VLERTASAKAPIQSERLYSLLSQPNTVISVRPCRNRSRSSRAKIETPLVNKLSITSPLSLAIGIVKQSPYQRVSASTELASGPASNRQGLRIFATTRAGETFLVFSSTVPARIIITT